MQPSDYRMVLTGVWRCITAAHGVQSVTMVGTLGMEMWCAVNWGTDERHQRIRVQPMDRVQGRFGWTTLYVEDRSEDYPAARSMDGAFTTVDTEKMPVLYAPWKVRSVYLIANIYFASFSDRVR